MPAAAAGSRAGIHLDGFRHARTDDAFEKSCEDLRDLYVNNQLYCRGEAVRIGEKFGIKNCEIGSVEERVSAVLAVE